ncbi:uncharacterized protein [Euwallacea similis]|uniref:uncharacterized protein n=1 Tax=Euwallacea similis TaxID=1736056 RepID=UPI00344B7699
MNVATERVVAIMSNIEKFDISYSEFHRLDILNKIKGTERSNKFNCGSVSLTILIFSLLANWMHNLDSECFMSLPNDASRLFRGPENCYFCEGFSEVDKIVNVSPTAMLQKYIKHSHPVVITDGASNWAAKSQFNFNFFKKLLDSVDINESKDRNCQFFPYETEFKSLNEVFNMTTERALMKEGEIPWYIGWNNCNDEVGRYLKQFYEKPYFFKNLTEHMSLSWVFMGSPGYGAQMHIDNVHYPSWQAQLSGKKLWKLAPPPECHYSCEPFEVVVEPGEIIVLDTNKWYHQTFVQPGEISITIGSEFD